LKKVASIENVADLMTNLARSSVCDTSRKNDGTRKVVLSEKHLPNTKALSNKTMMYRQLFGKTLLI